MGWMDDCWCLRDPHGPVWLVRRGTTPLVGGERIEGWQAARMVDEWFPVAAGIDGHHDTASEICRVLDPNPFTPRHGDWPRRLLREALSTGQLEAFRAPRTDVGGVFQTEEDDAKGEPKTGEKLTWIGIKVVDDSDPPQPVPGVRFRVVLPDGTERTGKLDAVGEAKLTGVEPGTCKISFPETDDDDWKPL